jgi:hypothetical protein
MARKRGRKRKTTMGYFRKVFEENPQWLKEKSNDVVFARYRKDHNLPPDAVLQKKVRYSLANTKSVMKKKGRRAARALARAGRPSVARRPTEFTLEALELSIDRSLWMAHNLDPEGLHQIIRLLRSARNEVILKAGQ